jgi:ferritin-like metal-binding protein YciE
MEESLKDSQGTIETLERQLVQAGIKNKVMQADVEINKEKEQIKTGMKKEFVQTQGEQKLLRGVMNQESKNHKGKLKQEMQNLGAKGGLILQQMQNNLQNNESEE